MARVELTEEALREAEAAARWYLEEGGSTLAQRFEVALRQALERVGRSPHRWPHIGTTARRVRLTRFPYLVIYVPSGEDASVIAVAHEKRRPGYWRRRVHSTP